MHLSQDDSAQLAPSVGIVSTKRRGRRRRKGKATTTGRTEPTLRARARSLSIKWKSASLSGSRGEQFSCNLSCTHLESLQALRTNEPLLESRREGPFPLTTLSCPLSPFSSLALVRVGLCDCKVVTFRTTMNHDPFTVIFVIC